jgi:hypothetical protein
MCGEAGRVSHLQGSLDASGVMSGTVNEAKVTGSPVVS